MDTGKPKFKLPPPNLGRKQDECSKAKPIYLTPSGMTLMTRDKQPPPMYGQRGATIPPKFMHEHRTPQKREQPQQQVNQHQHHQQHQQQQKQQPYRPPEPEYCESCDMLLQSADDMKRHRSQHERCPADGCKFHGLASVMDKHVMTLHSSGLYDKVKKLSTPEEIKAWREERKKKYPTLANIELKQRARDQRQRRGERLEASRERFGKREDRKRAHHESGRAGNQEGCNQADGRVDRSNERKRKRRRPNAENRERKMPAPDNSVKAPQMSTGAAVENEKGKDEKENKICDGVCGFRGTGHLKNYKHLKAKSKNVLSSLLGMYGSDEDDDDDDASEEDAEESDGESQNKQDTLGNVVNEENSVDEHVGRKEESGIETASTDTIERPVVSEENAQQNDRPEPDETLDQNASSDEGPDEVPISHKSLTPEIPKPTLQAVASSTAKEIVQKPTKPVKVVAARKIKPKNGLNYRLGRLRNQNTMLEKLLEQDIRHERNVLLQCVRFVCENKFFGIGATQQKVQK